jgi:hypothetical protein
VCSSLNTTAHREAELSRLVASWQSSSPHDACEISLLTSEQEWGWAIETRVMGNLVRSLDLATVCF